MSRHLLHTRIHANMPYKFRSFCSFTQVFSLCFSVLFCLIFYFYSFSYRCSALVYFYPLFERRRQQSVFLFTQKKQEEKKHVKYKIYQWLLLSSYFSADCINKIYINNFLSAFLLLFCLVLFFPRRNPRTNTTSHKNARTLGSLVSALYNRRDIRDDIFSSYSVMSVLFFYSVSFCLVFMSVCVR